MTSPAIKLAKECGAMQGLDRQGHVLIFDEAEVDRFHAKAQAQALRDAADELDEQIHRAIEWLHRMAGELERKI